VCFGHLDFFEKALFSLFAHFSIASLILGEFGFLRSLYILAINPLSIVAGQDFLPFYGLPLQSGDHFFCAEAFQFHVVSFVNPFF
jgi:hypothetical protein